MPVLEREEYIEQVYFFRTFRDRLIDGLPSQEILARIGEELLSTTKLPIAVSFLHIEMKGTGVMGPAHGADQSLFHAVPGPRRQPGRERLEPVPDGASASRARARGQVQVGGASLAALFVFQFEALARNRLGYNKGLAAMAADPLYTEDWQDYILTLRTRLGDVDFADLIFVRSEQFVRERQRLNPDFVAKFPMLFGEKEGKIARANRGRDPMYLFAALQRQLGYPEVPRTRRPDELDARVLLLEQKIAQLENRLKMAESDIHQDVDLAQVLVKPEDTAGVPKGWGKDDL